MLDQIAWSNAAVTGNSCKIRVLKQALAMPFPMLWLRSKGKGSTSRGLHARKSPKE